MAAMSTVEGVDTSTDTTQRAPGRKMYGEDVATVSHDLKGPLSVIALEASVLDEILPGPDDDLAHNALTRIKQNVAFIDRMIRDLIDLAAIESDHFDILLQPTDLSRLVSNTVARMTPTRERERVFVDVPGPVMVLADPARIERVVGNLMSNAFAYSPPGTRIEVRIDAVGERVRVSVIDHGPGLDREEAQKVFMRFHRTRAARSKEGNGLGLFVCHRIIDAHRGVLAVESAPGHGSRFYFELPRA